MHDKTRHIDYILGIVFLIACFLMCWRALYGLDWTDESYYLAVTERFFQGDRPFREEWFTTQLIGVLLLPLYSLYHVVTGGNDGILLFMRMCYVGISAFTSIFIYFHLVRNDRMEKIPAALFTFSYFFYVRANIPTLSYYSLGLSSFLIFLIFRREKSTLKKIAAGIAFAVSVLCMPYLVLYFAGEIVNGIYKFYRTKKLIWEESWIFVGIIISAVVVLIYFFISGNVLDIFINMHEILEDPEHQATLTTSLISFLRFMAGTFYRYLFWPEVLVTVGILLFCWKGRDDAFIKYLLKGGSYFLFIVQAVYLRTFFEGGIIIAFVALAVQISFLNDRKETVLWKKYAVPGLIFGVIWIVGSNVGQRVFNMGCLISCIWAYQIIWEDTSDTIGKWFRIGKSITMVITVGVLLLIRLFDIYRDGPVGDLSIRLEDGAGKGLFTTSERAEEYETVLKCLEKYAGEGRTLTVAGTNPWIYLEAQAECGAFAAWNVDFEDARNATYYERYPDKIPDVIFLLNPDYGKYKSWRYSSHGGNDKGNGTAEISGYFEKLVEEEEFLCYEEACGKFFVRNL